MKHIEPLEAVSAMEEMYRSVPEDLLLSGDWGFLVSLRIATALYNYLKFTLPTDLAFPEPKIGDEFKWRGVRCKII